MKGLFSLLDLPMTVRRLDRGTVCRAMGANTCARAAHSGKKAWHCCSDGGPSYCARSPPTKRCAAAWAAITASLASTSSASNE
eukprot:scaffold45035_cov49-Attheya_sp.AAC.6